MILASQNRVSGKEGNPGEHPGAGGRQRQVKGQADNKQVGISKRSQGTAEVVAEFDTGQRVDCLMINAHPGAHTARQETQGGDKAKQEAVRNPAQVDNPQQITE